MDRGLHRGPITENIHTAALQADMPLSAQMLSCKKVVFGIEIVL